MEKLSDVWCDLVDPFTYLLHPDTALGMRSSLSCRGETIIRLPANPGPSRLNLRTRVRTLSKIPLQIFVGDVRGNNAFPGYRELRAGRYRANIRSWLGMAESAAAGQRD